MSTCVEENLPEGDSQIAWYKHWWTNWKPFSHLGLAWLGAIFMSFFIAIYSSPFTLLPLWRDLQRYCDKHLSFSISVVSFLLVASVYTHSFSFVHFFLFLLPLIIIIAFPFLPLWYRSFSSSLSAYTSKWLWLTSPSAIPWYTTFRNEVFALKWDIHKCLKTYLQNFPPTWSRWIYKLEYLSACSQGKL